MYANKIQTGSLVKVNAQSVGVEITRGMSADGSDLDWALARVEKINGQSVTVALLRRTAFFGTMGGEGLEVVSRHSVSRRSIRILSYWDSTNRF